ELRTPVSRIVAEADLALRRERSGSEYRSALEVVLRNAKQVASTIEALVAAAQQEAGLTRGTADAYEAAAKAAAACAPAAAERERIFEPGLRGTAAHEADGDGAGLGLALARRLARAASGDIESLPSGDGGRFAVILPTA